MESVAERFVKVRDAGNLPGYENSCTRIYRRRRQSSVCEVSGGHKSVVCGGYFVARAILYSFACTEST